MKPSGDVAPPPPAEDPPEAVLARVLRPRPVVVILSGPSGVGKDEVVAGLKIRHPGLHFVVTTTTRPRRENEVDGVDYHFVSAAEFTAMIEAGELLEHAVVYGEHKGIPERQVRDALASGNDVILRIDVQGARTVRQRLGDSIGVFLVAESMLELERRLRERKTEPPDRLEMRVATAREELGRVGEFDYVVVNRRDHIADAVDTVLAILAAEKHRVAARRAAI